jgi:chemotaxis signal transduction protein
MTELLNQLSDVSILPRTLGISDENQNRERRDLLIMRVGSKQISVFADEADSVTEKHMPTPLPHAPQTILGVVSVRGVMYTVIDPFFLINSDKDYSKTSLHRFIVALRGDEQLALAVERVERIIEIFTDTIETPANINKVIRGLVQHDQNLVIILNLNEIFTAAMGEQNAF